MGFGSDSGAAFNTQSTVPAVITVDGPRHFGKVAHLVKVPIFTACRGFHVTTGYPLQRGTPCRQNTQRLLQHVVRDVLQLLAPRRSEEVSWDSSN